MTSSDNASLPPSARDALLRAWQEWDKYPTFESTAISMVRSIGEFADHYGIDKRRLRHTLALVRREGYSYEECLDHALEELLESNPRDGLGPDC